MRKTAMVNDNEYLRADGSNLAPFFEDFQLKPLRLRPDSIALEWRHKNSDQYFDASSFPDGTLRFIALTTLFLQPEDYRPSLILVDEPELGLHPYAIEMPAALICQASVTNQVIVSTQSSILLDHFAPEDMLVADRVDDGTRITRLDPKPLAKWLDDYSLGQLWEKNEFGGRPTPA
jgi:predicted ATPase